MQSDAKGACCGSCAPVAALPRTVAWLQWITLAWMMVECGAALWAAGKAHSLALLAFGADSLVEMLSATVVLLQFLPRFPLKKEFADRSAAVLLFTLAAVVVGISWIGRERPMEPTGVGIDITALALLVMPVLAWMKRREAQRMNNRALAADATQSATCAYLAGVTLTGLVIFAVWQIRWVDTIAALIAVPILIVEGRRAWRGEGCGCA
jgi:divalent metal cation (Fe/Co/Zn/Cd) transporter